MYSPVFTFIIHSCENQTKVPFHRSIYQLLASVTNIIWVVFPDTTLLPSSPAIVVSVSFFQTHVNYRMYSELEMSVVEGPLRVNPAR